MGERCRDDPAARGSAQGVLRRRVDRLLLGRRVVARIEAPAERVREVNAPKYRAAHGTPLVELAPLPAGAQFLNVIESMFSGMSRAIIQNSDYESIEAARAAIDRHFAERNAYFRANP